jgi:hypothetical protein
MLWLVGTGMQIGVYSPAAALQRPSRDISHYDAYSRHVTYAAVLTLTTLLNAGSNPSGND